MDQPFVSIVTTFYNSVKLGDFVHRAMNCLLNQTYQNIEFICVNDGSQDETLAQLKSYAKNDPRIKIINKENQGVAQYAKGAGQEIAVGDWIMLYDHDDLISYDAIEKAVYKAIQNPNLEAVSLQVNVKYISGETRAYHLLDQKQSMKFEKFDRIITGFEAYQKTVGRYDFYFRGLVKKEKFKAFSFNYKEQLVNGDEIIERFQFKNLTFIGCCSGEYEHFIFPNSSAKSISMKKIDMVRTNTILKSQFILDGVYESRKEIFELNAYKTLVSSVKIFQKLKNNVSKEISKKYLEYLKEGYDNLDKKIVLSQYKGVSFYYHKFLLSSFTTMMKFYQYKS
jgi:glycosyltransferase involved in cell wall biosynthesis